MATETPEWVKRAKAGDKVVCVKPDDTQYLTLGKVYTIKDVFSGGNDFFTKVIGFKLDEIDLELKTVNFRSGFIWSCFKPLETRKTDISIFTRMLKTKEVEKC